MNQEIPLSGGDAIINVVSGQWGVANILTILDETSASQSISTDDAISLSGSVIVLDSVNNSSSISFSDNVVIGEFLFSVSSQTNVNGVYYSTNING